MHHPYHHRIVGACPHTACLGIARAIRTIRLAQRMTVINMTKKVITSAAMYIQLRKIPLIVRTNSTGGNTNANTAKTMTHRTDDEAADTKSNSPRYNASFLRKITKQTSPTTSGSNRKLERSSLPKKFRPPLNPVTSATTGIPIANASQTTCIERAIFTPPSATTTDRHGQT